MIWLGNSPSGTSISHSLHQEALLLVVLDTLPTTQKAINFVVLSMAEVDTADEICFRQRLMDRVFAWKGLRSPMSGGNSEVMMSVRILIEAVSDLYFSCSPSY
jgi:hypothetical protein